MSAPVAAIKVKKTGRIRQPKLDKGPLTAIGNVMVAAQKRRWERAYTADGQPAKKLSVRYAIMKGKYLHTARPKRDMRLTGQTIANFQLRKAINDQIRAEPTQRKTRERARRAQQFADMIGFAGSDINAVAHESEKQYGKLLQKMWVPIG
jgi:hypothetical protein